MPDTTPNERIPITLLTGFLGTGKTTVLKQYLATQKPGSIAVIINEYGSTQVDGDLVSFAGDTAALETTNGCLCCTISGDVRDVLLNLANDISAGKLARFDQLIIETTGLADPMSLVHALTTNPDLNTFYKFDRTVTMVDAIKGEHWLEKYAECQKQILLGDVILLSKTDLIEDPISKRELDQFIGKLEAFNPATSIAVSNLETATDALKPVHRNTPKVAHEHAHSDHHHAAPHDHHHHHSHGVNSFSLSFEAPFNESALKQALIALGETYGTELLRVKGFVNVDSANNGHATLLVQGVGGVFQFTELDQQGADSLSQLVFITNALSKTEAFSYLSRTIGERIGQSEH